MHHFATLLGYGACAINPYLAQDSIRELIDNHMLDKDYYAAVNDYNNAVLHGIVKIASKWASAPSSPIRAPRFSRQSALIRRLSEIFQQYGVPCRRHHFKGY